MTNWKRLLILGSLVALYCPATSRCVEPDATSVVPMLHVSDLFRPHCDPDDHWDLACAYSLAWQGDAELVGVFIDHPQPQSDNDPDVMAVAQLNYLTGKAVPVIVGSPKWIDAPQADLGENAEALRGVRAMLDILRRSPTPVVISVIGSCRDVAIAGRLAPDLFAEKCAAIYLNAGSGTPDPARAKALEWNVSLDAQAYAAMFDLPCPIYWMPCFHEVHPNPQDLFQVGEYGTFFRFRQGDILPQLSEPLQNYFAYVFLQSRDRSEAATANDRRPNWLRYLHGPRDANLHSHINAMTRNMWCTGGFLHAVGKTVTSEGKIVSLGQTEQPVFTFDSIKVTCTPDGVTHWQAGTSDPPRFIFHVRDPQRYNDAMVSALKSLLVNLP